ncbi:MAG: M67 family metallopeptidase [Acidobacteriota bacterium]|jgi:proteasome lid subunit RPN8/RPN11
MLWYIDRLRAMPPAPFFHAMTVETESTLSISARHLHAVERHAAEAYPEECCGFLVGRVEEERGAAAGGAGAGDLIRVHRVLPTRNEQKSDPCSGYLIAPETVLAARREARSLGLEVVGYYHSHPDRPAEPSPTDRETAWDDMSYLIVAVEKGVPVDARSWRLPGDGEDFEEQAVEPVGDPAVLRSLGTSRPSGPDRAGNGAPG